MERHSLMNLLRYKRPAGSVTLEYFCRKYLEPVFGEPDSAGNYVHIIPDADGLYPQIAFTAHSDTVHKTEGIQSLFSQNNLIYSEGKECLGADCTTGVWLILEMIAEGIPGIYIIHAEEESGCIGSDKLVNKLQPDWLWDLKAVISFDRYGKSSIITHQMGRRTASDEFAESLADALGLNMKSDPTGSFTDSNEYMHIVPECTNISVGYWDQHTAKESQDINFAYKLRDALVSADWSKLVFVRDPSVVEFHHYSRKGWPTVDDYFRGWEREDEYDRLTLEDVVHDWPELVAEVLKDWGINKEALLDALMEIGADDPDFVSYALRYGAA